ncbi:hypothetical protein [Parasediminibacterium sp. JCM 36343]|uniref:hypothetical protein n=1 Tax=Parasediminibacterium sp. JCM 36343 TaxID=3374279 RepID=UPI003978C8B7
MIQKICFLMAASFLMIASINAQDTVYLKREAKKKIFTDRPPQAVFVELGGASPVFSANYDRRFNQQTDGLGFKVGIGYNFSNNDDGISITSLPVGINYLAGNNKRGRFFEIGFNETLLFAKANDTYGPNSTYDNGLLILHGGESKTLLFTSIALGYRSQPIAGGFNFRTGLLPYFIDSKTGVSAYLSFGYNF